MGVKEKQMIGPKTIVRTVAATEARIHFGEMLKRVYRDGEQLVIEKDGFPIAAILGHADYAEYRRLLALQALDALNQGANRVLREREMTEEDALADLAQIKKQVVAEQYGRAKPKRRKAR